MTRAANRSATALGLALAGDVVCVLVFAAVGRRTHAEADAVFALLATAGPFLVGLAAGWLAARGWRAPLALRTGVVVWLTTVIVGLAVRFAFTDRLPITFVVVVTCSLAVLLGWRAVAALISSSRNDRPDRPDRGAA